MIWIIELIRAITAVALVYVVLCLLSGGILVPPIKRHKRVDPTDNWMEPLTPLAKDDLHPQMMSHSDLIERISKTHVMQQYEKGESNE